MKYRTRTIIGSVTGQNSFGYYIAQQLYINGNLREDTTLKNNSPSKWSDSIIYDSPWYTISNKTSGTTPVSFGIYTNSGRSSLWADYSMDIDPAYPSGCAISFNSKTLNTITVNWSAGQNCSQVQYRINGGSWVNTLPPNSSQSSGSFTITGREPNTQYFIECDFQRADSGLWSSWIGNIPSTYVTTYDIARITSYPNFNLGDNLTINYTNPSGASIEVGVYDTNGSFGYAPYRVASGSSYTFVFTDTELDRFYKAMNGNSLQVNLYISTIGTYVDYHTVTITLTGNQKTIHSNISGTWKRGKIWKNVNGTWKRGVIWENVNGTWKRSI